MSPFLEIWKMDPFPRRKDVLDLPHPTRNEKTAYGLINIGFSTTRKKDQIIAEVTGIEITPRIRVNISPKDGKGMTKILSNHELRIELKPDELKHLRQI